MQVKLFHPPLSFDNLVIPETEYKRAYDFLDEMEDERRNAIITFHEDHRDMIELAKGSAVKHQAWEGGYIDHLGEAFRIAESLYNTLSWQHEIPFSLDSAIIVLYFHDIEKVWKYTSGLPEGFNKDTFLFETLAEDYDIFFTEEEVNALKYIHGETSDYDPAVRKMGPLGALCHSADTLSARMWPDLGKGLG